LALHLSTLNVGMQATEDSPWAVQAGVMILVTGLMFSLMRKAVKASGTAAARATAAIAREATPKGSDGATADLAVAGRFGQRSVDAAAGIGRTAKRTALAGAVVGTAVLAGQGAAVKGVAKHAAAHSVAGRAGAAQARRHFDAGGSA